MNSFPLISFLPLALSLLGPVSADPSCPPQRPAGTTTSLIATEYGTVFDAPVSIGNQEFRLLVDTGSSDTYVMQRGFTCVNEDEKVVAQDACDYSNKTYHKSRTYRQVQGQMFGEQYGAGLASGLMAYEQVSMGDITVQRQKVGIANESFPMGDGVNSGLLGLAYPSITSAHPSNQSSANYGYWRNRLTYNPLMNTMADQGLMDPYFSLALAHTPQNASTSFGGYMTLGGLPPVDHSPDFSTVPVEITDGIPLWYTSGKKQRSYWTTTVSNVTYGSSMDDLTTNTTSFQTFFDSGNYFSYLPTEIVEPINALFSPPAVYNSSVEAYVVDCDAKPPAFGISLGDQTFYHDGSSTDMIFQTGDGYCTTSLASSDGVSIGGVTLNIIGVSFLKNVVAVFDFGNDEMRFAKAL